MKAVKLVEPVWIHIVQAQELAPDSGICALVRQEQIAIFYETMGDTLYAVSNYDPIAKANVMSRGILGSIDGKPVVASPLNKQHYNLLNGECLEQPEYCLKVYSARIFDNALQIHLPL